MFAFDTKDLTPEESDTMAFRVLGDREALNDPRSGIFLNQLVDPKKSHHGVGKALLGYLSNPMCAIAPTQDAQVSKHMGDMASPFPALRKKAFAIYLRSLRQQMKLKSPLTITSGAWTVFDELENFTAKHKNTAFAKYVPWKQLKALAGPRMARDLYKDLMRFPAIRSRVAQAHGVKAKDLNDDKAIRALADGMVVRLRASMLRERKHPHQLRIALSR